MHVCVYVSFQNSLPVILFQEMEGNIYIIFPNQFLIKLYIKFYPVLD